jgi:hypothetical protein
VIEVPLAVLAAVPNAGGDLLQRRAGHRPGGRRQRWGCSPWGWPASLVLLSPTGGAPLVVPGRTWAIGLPLLLGLVASLALLGFRYEKNVRAGLLGVAVGVGYGSAAILFAVAGPTAARDGIGVPLECWQAYAAVVVGIASFSLLQQALHAGLLVVTAPGLTLANPLVAVVWGLLVFGSRPAPARGWSPRSAPPPSSGSARSSSRAHRSCSTGSVRPAARPTDRGPPVPRNASCHDDLETAGS